MSSRLTRTLLKLYPKRVRDRYGDELLDLQDELRAQGGVSRLRLIWDMLTGALVVRPARWVHLVIGAVLVVGGLVGGGAAIGGLGADSPARASHLEVRLASQIPYGSCFVADGSSCSLTPCIEFTGQSSVLILSRTDAFPPGPRSQPRRTGSRCVAYPHVRPYRPVFVSG